MKNNKPDMLGTSALKDRGWTDTAIKRFLGEPDSTYPNPHYRSGPPVKLWTLSRVEAVEQSEEFLEWKANADKRKRAAQAAVRTRAANMVERMRKAEVTIEKGWSFNEVYDLARRTHGGNYAGDPGPFFWSLDKGRNAIRHCLTNYEALWSICNRGETGEEAYRVLRERVDALIDESYPEFTDESLWEAAEQRRRQNPPTRR